MLRFAGLLVLPQCVFNTLGLTMYNAFVERVPLKNSTLFAPFVCIRVVTKGNYPQLIADNLAKNIDTCFRVGMEHFMVDVVTDKALHLPRNSRLREIVVPASYETKSRAMFKARALQYCLEDEVNVLRDDDWIVHLDEETLLTENSVRGILNFCVDGQHQFGQGLITYANGHIVNWLTTLADCFRVADDMGKLRFQLYALHRPLFGWKGSFVVTQVGAERRVSFDHGPNGSVAEDCYFSIAAYQDGFSFNFIEGEMHERSPFTVSDFLQQRKRWIQGIHLVVHSSELAWRKKIFLAMSFYAWLTMPLTLMNLFLGYLLPLPPMPVFDFLLAYVGGANLYLYIFGVFKSFHKKYSHRPWKLLFFSVAAIFVIPFNILIEAVAVILGMFSRKYQFYVVNKDPVTHVV
ncbi:unnamed protein product [Soboliphyme baturini]|uniref:Beta-1,4-mannosyltransferase bre-3 n=1 Tax=Soboliphyme baturini TaxID=241478 RepID=A0A183IGS0_9BILA|nr:unnamed protein product [Soboliphyme baturini]